MSQLLGDAENCQSVNFRPIENLSSKVNNLCNTSLEQGCSTFGIDTQGGTSDLSVIDTEALNRLRNASFSKNILCCNWKCRNYEFFGEAKLLKLKRTETKNY